MLFDNPQRICIAICTPIPKFKAANGGMVHETISPLWHRSRMGLATPTNINICDIQADGFEVGDARSQVAARVLEHQPPPEFLLFLDWDVLMPPDAMTKLFFRARCYPEHDIFAGVYCCKGSNPPDPLIYGAHGQGAIWDWAVGDILTTESHGVESVHMGLTLIRCSLFQKLKDLDLVGGDGTDQNNRPFFKTIYERKDSAGCALLQAGTEDIYFCDLVRKAGSSILVDTGVLAGHHDKGTGITYGLPLDDGPVKRARWLAGAKNPDRAQDEIEADGLKLAIDLGAGDETGDKKRHWKGHRTYTVDIRAEHSPDYVQDLRKLTLPDNHYDLVASAHVLEHLGRWDQEHAWREMFRICKPGGCLEVQVPSIEWAAHKIAQGSMDTNVMNVLYGAQEAHGYDQHLNQHAFGYTCEIARALADVAGFVDIKTTDWRQDSGLGYNLILNARKPSPEPVAQAEDNGCAVEAATVAAFVE
jgi:hypothetical protein